MSIPTKVLVANRGERCVSFVPAMRWESRLWRCTRMWTMMPCMFGMRWRQSGSAPPRVLRATWSPSDLQAAKDTGADAIHPGYGFLLKRASPAVLMPESSG